MTKNTPINSEHGMQPYAWYRSVENSLRSYEESREAKYKKEDRLIRRGLAAGAAVLALVGATYGLKKAAEVDPFSTNIPVPAMNEPHTNYRVKPGDTEQEIAERFGHPNDYNFMNMLNKQLPESDQPSRRLQPGEILRIPEE